MFDFPGRGKVQFPAQAKFSAPVVHYFKGVHGISEKDGPEATASLSFPNIHPWACNIFCWQSACD